MNLIVYFSCEGHTKKVAIKLHELINSEIFEIKTQNPYPKNHKELLKVAKKEWENQKLHDLENNINLDKFDTVYLCFPNWFGTIPLAVASFLKSNDFTNKKIIAICTHGGTIPLAVASFLKSNDFANKKIIAICTHGGGGFGNSLVDIEKLADGVVIGSKLAINSSDLK